ncbi:MULTISPECIES: ATP phosphoribosyltransferase regulatory subunit [Bacillales]|uniref:ATP phosphoribosyltransferase regulatory subunit n=1 Tax=Lysinibacillus louembei TaxID=1470088 RepID=A0ABZ0S292_9BACI|nr:MULTISPECIES: ATP phosphoribosyltransferase regulatory subunit [Bacillales]MCT6924622.1 ATP phosphoribosyltransferase regulatory subunit [Metasolibacillus sp.]MCT6940824.1 ATP phosphoribosyltransferase regulatory subunit [Metasolibacillus sp.]WPK13915.1 ATP phosphoribosyltransferase regulatory subunit [Lysinibacillus louembei]
MSTIKLFEKPLGMRDTFPQTYEKLEAIRAQGRHFLYARGYDFIKTPSVEYYDTVGKASAIDDAALFKLVDNQGNLLVLRPDMTTPIARIATAKLLKEKIPQRLAYFASVFRAQQTEGGRPAEFEQMGIELIGDSSVFADAEVIITAIQLLQQLGIQTFTITIGHARVLQAILQQYTATEEQMNQLRKLLVERNYVGFEEAVKSFALPTEKSEILLQFIEEAMNIKTVLNIEKYVVNQNELTYMFELEQLLKQANLMDYITFDFTITSHMNYYTGMLFEVFAVGSGFPLGNGGRYDGLLAHFGSEVGATGFGLRVDRLLEVVPASDATFTTTLLLFESALYHEALQYAADLRADGRRVTMQAIESLIDIAAYQKEFNEVVYVQEEGQR